MKINDQRAYNRTYYKRNAKKIQKQRMARLKEKVIKELDKQGKLMPKF